MSTVIRLVPSAHATKRTTMVGIEDDGRIRTRVEDPVGTPTDYQFNFGALPEGTSGAINVEPVRTVVSEKIGTDARFVIDVTDFYDSALTGADAPKERFVWYDYQTKAEDAPDSQLPQTATPTTPIYVLWTSAGTPASPTTAFNFSSPTWTRPSLYASLGSLAERRNFLKRGLLASISENPLWHVGTLLHSSFAVNTITSQGHVARLEQKVDSINDLIRFYQYVAFRPKMLALTLSIDANLDNEAKFNLLDGEINKIDPNLFAALVHTRAIAGYTPSSNITNWRFYRIGARPQATEPWTWNPPGDSNSYPGRVDNIAGISLTNANLPANLRANNGAAWITWLREEE